MSARPKHSGNCWCTEAVYDCRTCGRGTFCDVCHEHEAPRGDCSTCAETPRRSRDSASLAPLLALAEEMKERAAQYRTAAKQLRPNGKRHTSGDKHVLRGLSAGLHEAATMLRAALAKARSAP